jgi:hypothetical protein
LKLERNSFGRTRIFLVDDTDTIRELGVDLCQKECFGVACMEDKYHHYIENDVRRPVVYQFQEETSFPSSSIKHLRSIVSFYNTKPSSLSQRFQNLLENSSIFVIWVYVIQMWFQTVSGSS